MECPACGGAVTLEVEPDRSLSASLEDALLAATEDDHIEVSRNCWNCGWQEERHVRVEAIETTPGDDATIERATLIEDITDELTEIDSLATLKDALAEVKRQRRLEPTVSGEEDTTDP